MLEGIFGNKTAEKVLFHIFHYGEIHAAGIAKDYSISENQVRNQLERFENANILTSKIVGRSRLYQYNPKSPFTKSIQDIIKIAYNSIPLNERKTIFQERRRPRKKGKTIS